MALFESYERRIDHINSVLHEYGIESIEEAKSICDAAGIDPGLRPENLEVEQFVRLADELA